MPRVLLVEDDGFKSDEIQSLLLAVCSSTEIELAKSVSEAIGIIQVSSFDLIVLDMALPSHAAVPGAGAPLSLLTGGLEVLFELQSMSRQDPCIVVTQYPEMEICGDFYTLTDAVVAIERSYDIRVIGCVEYAHSSTLWRKTVTDIFGDICAS